MSRFGARNTRRERSYCSQPSCARKETLWSFADQNVPLVVCTVYRLLIRHRATFLYNCSRWCNAIARIGSAIVRNRVSQSTIETDKTVSEKLRRVIIPISKISKKKTKIRRIIVSRRSVSIRPAMDHAKYDGTLLWSVLDSGGWTKGDGVPRLYFWLF